MNHQRPEGHAGREAVAVYSGRQHANEVSSTSHIDKLAEQLVTDPEKCAMLNKVNVVVHPITNPDSAQRRVRDSG